MRREPPITFRGALQLLGRYERPWVDRLDKLLGGAILAAGVGLIAAPLAPLASLWGRVDQKSEAAGLLRCGLDRIQSKISKLQGYDRTGRGLRGPSRTCAASGESLHRSRCAVARRDVLPQFLE